MANIRELFFYVSGEHETLPYAEVTAILEAEGFQFKKKIVLPRLLCIESELNCLSTVTKKSGLIKTCGVIILKCLANKGAILHAMEEVDYDDLIKSGQTFSVKIKKIMRPEIDVSGLEKALGRTILSKLKGIRVNLRNPDVFLFGLIYQNFFILGKRIYKSPKDFLKRKPEHRPFSHPSSMLPKLARVMVNLARVSIDSLVLDPFCGAGAILIEAGLMGCKILGSEINSTMLRGAKRNLSHFGISWTGMVCSDARRLAFKGIDSIVTDPPYGRASSTHGVSIRKLVSDFLVQAFNVLPIGGHVVIALPDTLKISEISNSLGYVNVENHFIREHKSLTREISVIQKP